MAELTQQKPTQPKPFQPKPRVLCICGSPRRGNSEAIITRLSEMLENKGVESEIILLYEKNIERCDGCVENCNKKLECNKSDDMQELYGKIKAASGLVFVVPSYFRMPPGIFKDFIDRCSVFYTAKADFSGKRAVVIAVGADDVINVNMCLANITENFCKALGLPVIAAQSFRANSELGGNFNDIFENGLNPDINSDLEKMVQALVRSIAG
ncbi:MAG: flavodoxin family protein [Candidatus Aenigmatarchaeota archaeon]